MTRPAPAPPDARRARPAARAFAACLPLALALLAACQGGAPPAAEVTGAGEAGAALFGTVSLPRRLVLVPSPSPYPNPPSPLPSGPVLPARGAEVFCADAAGTRIPGIPKVRANEDGAYRLRGVPIGYAYVVTAVYRDVDGRPLRLRTLAHVATGPTEAAIDVGTTLVADAALAGVAGLVGAFPAAPFGRAATVAAARLAPDEATDPGDAASMAAALARLRAEDAAFAADLDAVRAAVAPAPALPTTSPSPAAASPVPSASPAS